ncbi:MAG: hypothetical protein E7028_01420 [Planctomycetaceae bacterium]|nr:hypothetical protein [Planctomycetaceae bacterium]MBQ2820766.1 hypothetical protein [Thermoguttaceae bacterium]
MKEIKSIIFLMILGLVSSATLVYAANTERSNVPSSQNAAAHSAVASKVEVANPAEKEKAVSSARNLTRQEIRSMPILERPNRFGHIYGNTVRRRHGL